MNDDDFRAQFMVADRAALNELKTEVAIEIAVERERQRAKFVLDHPVAQGRNHKLAIALLFDDFEMELSAQQIILMLKSLHERNAS